MSKKAKLEETKEDIFTLPELSTRIELREAVNSYLNGNSENYVDIGLWDISRITQMSFLFSKMADNLIDTPEKNALISGIRDWKVGHVTEMNSMFEGCTEFNQPLNGWDVSNVITMNSMFRYCHNFNQPLDRWITSKLTIAKSMFEGCREFNHPLNSWNVSRINMFNDMFNGCIRFNQPLNEWQIRLDAPFGMPVNMQSMFEGCIVFNQPLDRWNVSKVEIMNSMFKDCYEFNQPLNGWVVSCVLNMQSMFEDCYKFNQPLDEWDVSKVTNMRRMFVNCREFNQDLNDWDVETYVYTDNIFQGCDSMTMIPNWYMHKIAKHYPKSKFYNSSVPTRPSHLIAGVNFPDGIDLREPPNVDPYDPNTMNPDYWQPQADITEVFLKTIRGYEKSIIKQYVNTNCYLQEVDCYVGNRLTTYLLTIHPEIVQRYPQYQNILVSEEFSIDWPVVFKERYITEEKILSILRGFRDLNVTLKRFPPLDATAYPNGFYLYRAKRYEGEIEKLSLGEQFVLSKLTSTSMDIQVSATTFATGIDTKYEDHGTLVTRPLAFFWRIKMPLGLPFAYINEPQKEVVLPIGTRLRFLGCHVQLAGPNSIYTTVTDLDSFYFTGKVYGALICEFEVLEISEGPLLSVLADTVKRDFATGNSAIYANDFTLPGDWDKYLRKKEILPDEAFGKRRTKKNKRKTNKRKTHKKRSKQVAKKTRRILK
jgi:surface protein